MLVPKCITPSGFILLILRNKIAYNLYFNTIPQCLALKIALEFDCKFLVPGWQL